MGDPQIIRTPSGDETVVMSRADYEALLAAAEDVQEDADDLATGRRRWHEWEASGRLTTPPDVAQMILDGEHVLEAYRHSRGVSVEELAARCGIPSVLVRKIEMREATGDDVGPCRCLEHRARLVAATAGRGCLIRNAGRTPDAGTRK